MPNNDKIKSQPFRPSWKDSGFDSNLQRPGTDSVNQGNFIGGANFDVNLDEMLFNRMIMLKNLTPGIAPQGSNPGKIYWDPDNKKYKLYVNDDVGWVDVQYTSTTTSSTSSSSSSSSTSSTSTSSTSSSTSSTSNSTSSTSTSSTSHSTSSTSTSSTSTSTTHT